MPIASSLGSSRSARCCLSTVQDRPIDVLVGQIACTIGSSSSACGVDADSARVVDGQLSRLRGAQVASQSPSSLSATNCDWRTDSSLRGSTNRPRLKLPNRQRDHQSKPRNADEPAQRPAELRKNLRPINRHNTKQLPTLAQSRATGDGATRDLQSHTVNSWFQRSTHRAKGRRSPSVADRVDAAVFADHEARGVAAEAQRGCARICVVGSGSRSRIARR